MFDFFTDSENSHDLSAETKPLQASYFLRRATVRVFRSSTSTNFVTLHSNASATLTSVVIVGTFVPRSM